LEKIRKIYANIVNMKLSSSLVPDDLGYKHAMIHAEMLLNDYVPSQDNCNDKN
jgi:hypothetical protein